MDLPTDIWVHVLSNMLGEQTSGLQFRINKSSNLAFLHFISTGTFDIFPRRTFIETNRCMKCEKYDPHIRCMNYIHDNYPRRMILFCNKFECFVHAMRKFIHDMNRESTYPFVAFENRNIWIPRSSGGVSQGKVAQNSPLMIDKQGHPCVIVEMENQTYVNRPQRFSENIILTLVKKVPIEEIDIGPIRIRNDIFFQVLNVHWKNFKCLSSNSHPDFSWIFHSSLSHSSLPHPLFCTETMIGT